MIPAATLILVSMSLMFVMGYFACKCVTNV